MILGIGPFMVKRPCCISWHLFVEFVMRSAWAAQEYRWGHERRLSDDGMDMDKTEEMKNLGSKNLRNQMRSALFGFFLPETLVRSTVEGSTVHSKLQGIAHRVPLKTSSETQSLKNCSRSPSCCPAKSAGPSPTLVINLTPRGKGIQLDRSLAVPHGGPGDGWAPSDHSCHSYSEPLWHCLLLNHELLKRETRVLHRIPKACHWC